MTNSMIERVARAICDCDPDVLVPQASAYVVGAIGKNPYGSRVLVDQPPIPAWKLYEAKARAAIGPIADMIRKRRDADLKTAAKREREGSSGKPYIDSAKTLHDVACALAASLREQP